MIHDNASLTNPFCLNGNRAVDLLGKVWYTLSVCEVAGRSQALYAFEESPSAAGQGAGEMPAEATPGKVQQRDTAKPRFARPQGWKGEVRAHQRLGDLSAM